MKRRWSSAWLAVLMICAGCHDHDDNGHDHSEDHPEGHDHHEDGHGHGDGPVVRITQWGGGYEVFAEHPPAVVGQEVELLAHLTILDGFAPLTTGTVTLQLDGPAKVTAKSDQPIRPGIYTIGFTPSAPGTYRGRIIAEGPPAGTVDDITIEVHPNADTASKAAPSEEHDELIELLKEQQWGVPFATAFAEAGSLVPSIQVAGTVDTPPGGLAEVGAPVAGRLVAPKGGLPRPGQVVKKGQLLAQLVPAPSSPEDAVRTKLAVSEAEARRAAAVAAADRAERLFRDKAIAKRELEDTRRELTVAEEAVRTARRSASLFSGAQSGGGAGSWRLVAPMSGTVTKADAMPGAQVSPGDVLFRILDPSELWIRARVPEQDAARLRSDRDASYQIAGRSDWLPIDITGEDATAKVVTVSPTVDPTSRTVDVIYSLTSRDPNLRVGGLVQVALPTGEDFDGVVIPRSAVVDQDGRQVVYVQVDGEHFAERQVAVGPRAGPLAGILRGLKAGERIVTAGASVVRLADKPDSAQPHGHIH